MEGIIEIGREGGDRHAGWWGGGRVHEVCVLPGERVVPSRGARLRRWHGVHLIDPLQRERRASAVFLFTIGSQFHKTFWNAYKLANTGRPCTKFQEIGPCSSGKKQHLSARHKHHLLSCPSRFGQLNENKAEKLHILGGGGNSYWVCGYISEFLLWPHVKTIQTRESRMYLMCEFVMINKTNVRNKGRFDSINESGGRN